MSTARIESKKERTSLLMTARILRFVAPRIVEISEIDLPEPSEGEVLVETAHSGVSSGTELLAYRGEIDPRLPLDERIGSLGGTFSHPFSYGYSSVGIVERSKAHIPPGTLVFVLHPHQDRFVCAASDAIVLPDVDPRVATLFPLVETALQVSLDAGHVAGEMVAVMGLGSVGLLTAILLQRAGARVVGVDPSEWRCGLARDLDVDAVTSPRLAAGGVPLVVEVSGNPAALAAALTLLDHEGTVLVASWYGTKPVTLDLGAEFHRRRLTIRSTQVSTIPSGLSGRWTFERRRDTVLRLLGELPLKRLATHEFPFEKAPEAFAALDRGDPEMMHVALAYRKGR